MYNFHALGLFILLSRVLACVYLSVPPSNTHDSCTCILLIILLAHMHMHSLDHMHVHLHMFVHANAHFCMFICLCMWIFVFCVKLCLISSSMHVRDNFRILGAIFICFLSTICIYFADLLLLYCLRTL